MFNFVDKSFDTLLNELRGKYNHMVDECNRKSELLANWNKNDEIQKAKEETDYVRYRSLHVMTDVEMERVGQFRKKHGELCGAVDKVLYEIVDTEISQAITVICPVCGAREDVTDYAAW